MSSRIILFTVLLCYVIRTLIQVKNKNEMFPSLTMSSYKKGFQQTSKKDLGSQLTFIWYQFLILLWATTKDCKMAANTWITFELHWSMKNQKQTNCLKLDLLSDQSYELGNYSTVALHSIVLRGKRHQIQLLYCRWNYCFRSSSFQFSQSLPDDSVVVPTSESYFPAPLKLELGK